MVTNWQTKKLGDVCFYDKSQYDKSNLPYVGLEDIESNTGVFMGSMEPKNVKSNTFYFTKEHLLYGRLRPYLNKVLLPNFEGHCSTEIFPIKVRSELNKKFLFYWIISESIAKKINSTWTGSRMPRANMNSVLDFLIPTPPLTEQKRIVKKLDAIFENIDKAKENTERNLQNSKELFESYLQSVFDNDVEYKKLGDKSYFKIVDGDRGKNYPKKSDFFDEGYCLFLNTKNVRSDGFDFHTTMFVTKNKDETLGNGKLQRNDVLLTTRGTIGNIAVYDDKVPFQNIRINSGMLIFRPNMELINPKYLFAVFQSGIMKSQIKKYVSGAAQPQLPIKTLVNFSIPIPEVALQSQIAKKLDELSEQTKKLEENYKQKLVLLDELKKSILEQAFSGNL